MILVTGATGTIGRELLPQLLEAGEQVRASGIKIGIEMDKVPKAGRPNRRLLRPQLRSPMSSQTAYENEDEPGRTPRAAIHPEPSGKRFVVGPSMRQLFTGLLP
jgi:hypothetical protein